MNAGELHGFVVWRTPDGTRPGEVRSFPRGEVVVTRGAGLRAWSRPFVTTPEGAREVQPLVSPTTLLWYQGFVADRGRLTRELGAPELSAAGDGALLLAAFAAWREGLVDHVMGEYSYLALDRQTGRLVAGSDALGLRPVVYATGDAGCWVASNLETLLAALPQAPTLDPEALRQFLAGRGQGTGRTTVWRGVFRLEQGRVLVHTGGAPRELRAWRPQPTPLPDTPREELAERLRAAVSAAVADALRSDGHVWCDLSGGLDSSTLAAAAARLGPTALAPGSTLRAFSTIYPTTPKADERAFQRLMVERYGLVHEVVDVDQCRDYTELDPYRAEPTFATFRGALERTVRQRAQEAGVRVNLTGVGGDQVFAFGDFPPLYLHTLLRRAPIPWARELTRWARGGRRSLWNLVTWCSLRPSPNSVARRVVIPPPDWAFSGLAPLAEELERDAWTGGETTFPDVATELQYRMLRRIGAVLHSRNRPPLEYRHPLLDRRVVELALALPWNAKLTPELDRVLQRQAFVEWVPAPILARRDKGNMTFARFAGLRENWPVVVPFSRGTRLAELGLVDPDRFQAACLRMRHGLREHGWLFLAVALNLEAWLRQRDEPAPNAAAETQLREAVGSPGAALTAAAAAEPSLTPRDRAFLQRFDTGRLPRWRYRHHGRLRVAWLYLRLHGPNAGPPRLLAAFRAYDARCRRGCHHETLTRFWIERVRQEMAAQPGGQSFRVFLARHPELTRFQHVYTYYQRTTLFSPAARETWVAPDLRPLDLPGSD